jgi:hypothetical protein
MTMNRFAHFYRDVTCAAGAALITLMLSLSFVESTTAAPFHVAPAAAATQSA